MPKVASPAQARAAVLPSGARATWVNGFDCVSVFSTLPVATSQTRTVSSRPADTRRPPSGLNASDTTVPRWPESVLSVSPVAASQTRMLPSCAPAARVRPSADTATAVTGATCPKYARAGGAGGAAAVQARAVPSCDTDTAGTPGANSTAATASGWAAVTAGPPDAETV